MADVVFRLQLSKAHLICFELTVVFLQQPFPTNTSHWSPFTGSIPWSHSPSANDFTGHQLMTCNSPGRTPKLTDFSPSFTPVRKHDLSLQTIAYIQT